MAEKLDDTRAKAILTSAFQAFSAYGFRKTSMDDIARGAGMSRPAVYLHYKNKEAIVRSLTHAHYAEKIEAVAQALQGDGTVPEILARAIDAQIAGMAAILASPHGLEMLDTSKSTAADIVAEGEAALADLYAEWLKRELAAGRVRLPDGPAETARTITATLKGIKMTASNAEEFEQRIAQLSALIGAGLEVR
ncbi:TetR/AcrR family transcriptional regulator [Ruegeria arenilitoris]|uniref:TetR/AcrR family transcriptional regulator n=1 Tax=Ruegeria arenilitoris TaxID=1173585 RepID=UPI00147A20B5|nr:TetR/AcrR family transcriptional regulator [Ruegeria arenilitoris]